MHSQVRSRAVLLAGVLLVGLCAHAPAALADRNAKPKSQQILECLAGNFPSQGGKAIVTLNARGSAGGVTRYRWQLYWSGRGDQRAVVIQVTAPMDVAGSAYLLRQTNNGRELYLYSPAIDAVRRIQGDASGSQKVFGTDVALRDLVGVGQTLANGTLSYMGEETLDGKPVDKMLALPPPDAHMPYSRIALYIGQGPCVLRRLEFSRDGAVSKVYTAVPGSLQQTASGLQYLSEWTLHNPDSGESTHIRINELQSSPNFSSGTFGPDSFYH